MRRAAIITIGLAALGLGAWSGFGRIASAGTTLDVTDYPAPTFVARADSVHNNGTTHVCGAFVPHNDPPDDGENRGDLNHGKGSYLTAVHLPNGARVVRFTVFVNDNDGDPAHDTHAYLVRKRIAGGLSPKDAGYRVLAHTHSTGAKNNVMRAFADTTIARPTIDNTDFMYYVELVVCPVTEPFAVRIATR